MWDDLTLGTWNLKRGGWNAERGRHELDAAMAHLTETSDIGAPDILAWPEGTFYLDEGQRALHNVTNRLTELLAFGYYEAFVTELDGHRNHPVLFVNRCVVKVEQWWPAHRRNSRRAQWGWLRATVAGIADVWISAQHWTGSAGPSAFSEHASLVAPYAVRRSILLGDFNQTSSWPGEVAVDWHAATEQAPYKRREKGVLRGSRWWLNTEDIDYLRHSGFRDLGELAGDPTPTTNTEPALRIDRIFLGADLPAELTSGSYRVHETPMVDGRPLSDHRLVTATVRLTVDAPDTTSERG